MRSVGCGSLASSARTSLRLRRLLAALPSLTCLIEPFSVGFGSLAFSARTSLRLRRLLAALPSLTCLMQFESTSCGHKERRVMVEQGVLAYRACRTCQRLFTPSNDKSDFA